jgi:hypothetical protein
MKLILTFLMTLSAAFGQDLYHRVLPNKLIKSGEITISYRSYPDYLKTIITYKVKGPLIPKKYRQGSLEQDIPIKYETEDGYIDLMLKGRESYKNVLLVHEGLSNGVHSVGIYPSHGNWKARAYYNSSIISLGWERLEVTLKSFPKWPIYSELID